MEQRLATVYRPLQGTCIGEVALDDIHRQRIEVTPIGAFARQHPNLPLSLEQRFRDGSTDESGRARDQRLHDRCGAMARKVRIATR